MKNPVRSFLCIIVALLLSVSTFSQTWVQVQSPATSTLYCVSFKDTLHGLAGGGSLDLPAVSPVLVQSAPSGSNWSLASPDCGDEIDGISYVQTGNAFAIANRTNGGTLDYIPGNFMKSTNDAQTFSCDTFAISNSSGFGFHPTRIWFRDSLNGFVAGHSVLPSGNDTYTWGQILKTTNGGASWTATLGQPHFVGQSTSAPYVIDLNFISAQIGYALKDNDSILKTTDGGSTWTLQSTAGNGQTMKGIYFLSENAGLTVGNGSTLARTGDGGVTWNNVQLFISSTDLTKIVFTDSLHGWIIGGNKILHSIDGGNTWPFVDSFSVTINDICMLDDALGFAVGGQNIYKYTCAASTTNISHSICSGQTFSLAGQTFNSEGGYTISLSSSGGCDSTVNLALAVNALPSPVIADINGTLSTGNFARYQWLYNGAPLTGDTAAALVPSIIGSYSVIVVDQNGCIDTSAVDVISSITGIESPVEKSFSLWPNPAQTFVVVDGLPMGTNADAYILIYNSLGNVVGKFKANDNGEMELSISDFPNGVYFVRPNTNDLSLGIRRLIILK